MYAIRTHYVDHGLIKAAILVISAILIVLIATRSAAAEHTTSDADVSTSRAESTSPASVSETATHPVATPPTARQLWEILRLHKNHEFTPAIERWQRLSLFDCDEQWRNVAIAASHLRLGNLDDALCVLEDGNTKMPANAVNHHLRGVIQAANARLATQAGKLYMAEDFRDDALREFEMAVATASQVKIDHRLGLDTTKFVSTQRAGRGETIFPERLLPPRTPRVRDLLSALDLSDFLAKSHIGLAEIVLQDGRLEEAEDHLDDAAKAGGDVAAMYVILGENYEAEGETTSAARAFMKAMTGKRKIGSAMKALRNLRRVDPLN